MRIDVDEVRRLKGRLAEINCQKFDDIIWSKSGKEIIVPEKLRNDWKYMGLNNCDICPLLDGDV